MGPVGTRWNPLEHVRTCWDTFGPVGTRFQEVISLSYPEKLEPHGFIINNILWIRKINGFQLCLYSFLTKKSRNSKHILVWSVKWDPLEPVGTRYNLLGHVRTRSDLLEHVCRRWIFYLKKLGGVWGGIFHFQNQNHPPPPPPPPPPSSSSPSPSSPIPLLPLPHFPFLWGGEGEGGGEGRGEGGMSHHHNRPPEGGGTKSPPPPDLTKTFFSQSFFSLCNLP